MSRPASRLRRGPLAVATTTATLALLVHLGASAATVRLEPGESPPGPINSRVSVAVGYSLPSHWSGLDSGYGLALRLEAETSPLTSPFVEFAHHTLAGPRVLHEFGYPGYVYREYRRDEVTLTEFAVGLRFHLTSRAALRPYLEAAGAARFASGEDLVRAAPGGSPGDENVPVREGFAGIARLGATMAAWRGAGLFADAGWEFLAENPLDYGVVAFRVGATFP